VKSHLPAIKPTGYRLRQVNVGLWFSKPALPLRFSSGEILIGKPATRRVFWSRLVCSSGLLIDMVTPLNLSLQVGDIMLVENGPDDEGKRDPEIELARVESKHLADFGLQLIKYAKPLQFGNQSIQWAVLEAIWNTRGDLVVRGRSSFQEKAQAAKRLFEEEAKCLAEDPLLESYEPTRREQVAETGKWQALKDIHPKTLRAIDKASLASDQDECEKYSRTAADEFGKEFYALRKQIVWPAKQNVTPAVAPLDKVPAAQRKSIGRRKPRPNLPDRYMATYWILRGVADMSAAQLADHLNKNFNTSFTASQIRTRRKRLQLFVDWEGDPQNKA
jgi:hypothetical protein